MSKTKLNDKDEPVNENAALVVTDQPRGPMDVSDMALLPVEQQEVALTEYAERRDFFHGWLLNKMKEGVHYGFPPGCRPGKNDKQWKSKPSLYKSGALLLCDLLRVRFSFMADVESATMLGATGGVFVMRCELISRVTGEVLGEGRGVFEVGKKGMDSNSALKMAQKRAHVDAVINTIPVLADLFTQDMEDKAAPGAKPDSKTTYSGETLATEKQANYVKKLLDSPYVPDAWKKKMGAMAKGGLTKDNASKIIEKCKEEIDRRKAEDAEKKVKETFEKSDKEPIPDWMGGDEKPKDPYDGLPTTDQGFFDYEKAGEREPGQEG